MAEVNGLPSDLTTATDTVAQWALGTKIVRAGIEYTYIQIHASGSACAVKTALYRYAAATPWVLTAAGAAGNLFAGVGIGTIAVGSYGWVVTDGDVVVFTDEATSVSTYPAGSPAFSSGTSGKLTVLQLAVCSTVPIANYQPCGFVTVPVVSSLSTPRYCTIKVKAQV